jgi:hypothetical protein
MIKKVLLLVTFCSFAVLVFGQVQPTATNPSPFVTTACYSTYTFGSGATAFKWCVTGNGNITQLMGPYTYEHIQVGAYTEGYGLCSAGVNYYDYAAMGDSYNWGPATIVGTPGTFPFQVIRTTTDGLFTLTQTFSQTTTEKLVKIAMKLKNNVPIAKTVTLMRFVDIDATGVISPNTFDYGWDSAWGYRENWFGVMLSVRPPFQGGHNGNVVLLQLVKPCALPTLATVPFQGDGAAYVYNVVSIPANGTKTINFGYRIF